MDTEELLELREQAHDRLQRRVGVTMAVFAAFLALVTLMGHRLHTEEVVLQTRLADQWAYYQAKNTRAQLYSTDAALAGLQGPQGATLASTWTKRSQEERQQADDIRLHNEELDRETQHAAIRATRFDSAEVFIEAGIVLCSIALLTAIRGFWLVAFAPAVVGIGLGLAAFFG
jgi:hypothetical protein